MPDFNKLKHTLFITTILGYIQEHRAEVLARLLAQHNSPRDYSPEVDPDLLLWAQIEQQFLQLMSAQSGQIPDINLDIPRDFFNSIAWIT
jgi:hypothetical protein